jgi:hypothetical protein
MVYRAVGAGARINSTFDRSVPARDAAHVGRDNLDAMISGGRSSGTLKMSRSCTRQSRIGVSWPLTTSVSGVSRSPKTNVSTSRQVAGSLRVSRTGHPG